MRPIRILLMTFTSFTESYQSSRALKFKRSALNRVVVDLKFIFRSADSLIKPQQFQKTLFQVSFG